MRIQRLNSIASLVFSVQPDDCRSVMKPDFDPHPPEKKSQLVRQYDSTPLVDTSCASSITPRPPGNDNKHTLCHGASVKGVRGTDLLSSRAPLRAGAIHGARGPSHLLR